MAKFLNIATATTTTVKSGRGTLYGINVNKAVASGVITIYDNTAASGTKIGTITSPATLLHNQIHHNFQRLDFYRGLDYCDKPGGGPNSYLRLKTKKQ